MLIPDKWLLLIGTMAYVAALVLTLVRLSNRQAPSHGLNLGLILCGWLMQSAGLWILGVEAGSCPIRNPFEVLQFVSWSIVILYLFTGQVFRLSLFGTGSASLAAIIGFTAFLIVYIGCICLTQSSRHTHFRLYRTYHLPSLSFIIRNFKMDTPSSITFCTGRTNNTAIHILRLIFNRT